MSLRLYNSLSRQKEPLVTAEPNIVKMYCCGVTVYDYCHLGHARSYIVWDVVRRYLMWRGYKVRYVQNFTDIDDKILRRAREEHSTMEAVSEKYIQAYFEDMARLNILPADEYPRATHTLDGIKRLIHELEQQGMAYAAAGDVYYSVRKFTDYGKLSGRKLEEMQAGASGRVESSDPEASKKQDPFDFALWKAAKPDEPAWESDWGKGRPGWHIECSAMVRDRFGDSIDIHTGGADLVFPHHENEIAQSEAVTGKPLSRYWMHNGMVNVDGEKMSKSLGNFTTIRQLLDNPLPILNDTTFDPMALRLFVLQAQYRKPLDFTDEAIQAAQHSWVTIREGLLFGWNHGPQLNWPDLPPDLPKAPAESEAIDQFRRAMDDDFNTPEGLAVLFELAKTLKRNGNILKHGGQTDTPSENLYQTWLCLRELAGVLGLVAPPEIPSVQPQTGPSAEEIEALITRRQSARESKDFATADQIRDELKAQGIQLIDQPGGVTSWIRE
ncbi:cysteine--tRNA ligase [Lyngbya confervoides]|uniref:Cysteine--tRNA ligase n=1 Tax=Lyngbya confervoides BDU141951 TaxID=1574623 RepID=A0ABD4SZ07_9CYAN|nr:cysteine--tRNA ligase [Lyngbya confervoides]MCM1981509.1 cysteine--tRNA ligase [Lyngbya confervoides BDU141951]